MIFNGFKKVNFVVLELSLASSCNLVWFQYWVFSFWSTDFVVSTGETIVFEICLFILDNCFPMVLRLVLVKFFCLIMCLVFMVVSSLEFL